MAVYQVLTTKLVLGSKGFGWRLVQLVWRVFRSVCVETWADCVLPGRGGATFEKLDMVDNRSGLYAMMVVSR
jgi:hypothetical protein